MKPAIKPIERMGKGMGVRVPPSDPDAIIASNPFLSLQQLTTKKLKQPKRSPENESKSGSKPF
jgi:hypothetical protein